MDFFRQLVLALVSLAIIGLIVPITIWHVLGVIVGVVIGDLVFNTESE